MIQLPGHSPQPGPLKLSPEQAKNKLAQLINFKLRQSMLHSTPQQLYLEPQFRHLDDLTRKVGRRLERLEGVRGSNESLLMRSRTSCSYMNATFASNCHSRNFTYETQFRVKRETIFITVRPAAHFFKIRVMYREFRNQVRVAFRDFSQGEKSRENTQERCSKRQRN
ncbi:hypothetical protein FGO68_gene2440 [Halteria grandinella]|uniref:Uncharacterized protein n=1 Tax=Halteria grandinella TaxID=5974 RepID=A0A8J8NNQ8_HALGN|nr:hypothetical protein FGO68_gene2440 [Halteria grandinella]